MEKKGVGGSKARVELIQSRLGFVGRLVVVVDGGGGGRIIEEVA